MKVETLTHDESKSQYITNEYVLANGSFEQSRSTTVYTSPPNPPTSLSITPIPTQSGIKRVFSISGGLGFGLAFSAVLLRTGPVLKGVEWDQLEKYRVVESRPMSGELEPSVLQVQLAPAYSIRAEDPSTLAGSRLVTQMVTVSGLGKGKVANDLLGVERQTLYHWERGITDINSENLKKVTQICEVLDLAKESLSDTNVSVREWLYTPRGIDGVTPQGLILQGDFTKARLLAIASLPRKRTEIPGWLRSATGYDVNKREAERRTWYADSDDILSDSKAVRRDDE